MLNIKIANLERTGVREVVNVRYRVRDGARTELSYRSDIVVPASELTKYNADGTLKEGETPRMASLPILLERERARILQTYNDMKEAGRTITSKTFGEECRNRKTPSLLYTYGKFVNDIMEQGVVSPGRHKHFITTGKKLERFLTVNNQKGILPDDFDGDLLLQFKDFVKNEHEYVASHPQLYKDMNGRQVLKKPLEDATVESDMKILSTFFTKLENADEIQKSPFRQIKALRRREGIEDFSSLKRFIQANYPEAWKEYLRTQTKRQQR